MWNAIRALEEIVMLLQQAAEGLEDARSSGEAQQSQLKQAQEQLTLLRSMVMDK